MEHELYLARVPAAILFEGWDAGGKGGAIRRLTGGLDPRGYEVIPIAAPDAWEKAHHYLWRFWEHVPKAGHIAIFDRTWYGRVLVERVEGFATEAEWKRAYEEINDFERQLADFGTVLVKFWLQIDADEQLRRFHERQKPRTSNGRSPRRTGGTARSVPATNRRGRDAGADEHGPRPVDSPGGQLQTLRTDQGPAHGDRRYEGGAGAAELKPAMNRPLASLALAFALLSLGVPAQLRAQPGDNEAADLSDKSDLLTLADITRMHRRHVPLEQIVDNAAEQGLGFEVTAAVASQLRRLGFHAAQIEALKDFPTEPLVPARGLATTEEARSSFQEMKTITAKSGVAVTPLQSQHFTLWGSKETQKDFSPTVEKLENFFRTKWREPIRSGLEPAFGASGAACDPRRLQAVDTRHARPDRRAFRSKGQPRHRREEFRASLPKGSAFHSVNFGVICLETYPDEAGEAQCAAISLGYMVFTQLACPRQYGPLTTGFANIAETVMVVARRDDRQQGLPSRAPRFGADSKRGACWSGARREEQGHAAASCWQWTPTTCCNRTMRRRGLSYRSWPSSPVSSENWC